jgi:hypothetical protein
METPKYLTTTVNTRNSVEGTNARNGLQKCIGVHIRLFMRDEESERRTVPWLANP